MRAVAVSVSLIALIVVVSLSRGQEPKPSMLTAEEKKLRAEATKLDDEGFELYQQGKPLAAVEKMREALEIREKLFIPSRFPDGHTALAASFNNLGGMLRAMGQAEKALTFHQRALDMQCKLYPSSKFPDGHPDIATSLHNLAISLQAMGHAEKALTYFQQSHDMKRKLYPGSKYPDGHPAIALSLNNLGAVLNAMGQAEKALNFYRQGLDMRRTLYPLSKYPDGHPAIALSLNNLGALLNEIGQTEQALGYIQQSLDMWRKLYPVSKYPDGHPDLATSLHNLSGVFAAMGQAEKALDSYQQSLEMYGKLYPASKYPDGHPNLAQNLNNLGFVLKAMGKMKRALGYYQDSLSMRRKLYPASKYPDGHANLVQGLHNLGLLHQAMGQADQALLFHYQSLEMQQRLLRRELATASEEAAFDKITAAPLIRDVYLSVSHTLKMGGRQSFTTIWPSRAMVTRLLEQRHANTRAARTEAGGKLDELRSVRRRIEQLLQDRRMNAEERDQLLVEYSDRRDKLERELAVEIPALKRWQELDKLGPGDLVKALPAGAVFVDVIRYTHFEYVDGKEKTTPSYVAFVVASGERESPDGAPNQGTDVHRSPGIARVELGAADPIDAAVRQWRDAIEARRDEPKAVAELRLVWDKLAPALPTDTKTFYLSADGDLARLPWAALPVEAGQVLLEKYALAQVPHGIFLLDHLRNSRTFAGASLFALGGVEYGSPAWPALPGTLTEMKAIATLAPGELETTSGTEATSDKVTAGMARARYVHLATHGEFQAEVLSKERQRAAKALEARRLSDETRIVAAKNPLGYVGLVLAGGEVLSGLGIVDLPLKNTQLVTLSACETGLGEYTGGEGVQGLQRAFHLAGCPNVVASLWKVNDAATAALMAKFYHEMWVNKKPPIEALREAQLTIYRHPELVPDLAGERGAVRVKEAVGVRAGEPSGVSRRVSDTKLWAAFVLSGVGR